MASKTHGRQYKNIILLLPLIKSNNWIVHVLAVNRMKLKTRNQVCLRLDGGNLASWYANLFTSLPFFLCSLLGSCPFSIWRCGWIILQQGKRLSFVCYSYNQMRHTWCNVRGVFVLFSSTLIHHLFSNTKRT